MAVVRSPRRILVTGPTGFVGRTIVPALRAVGHEVEEARREAIGDIASVANWPRLLAGADAVVQLAALAHARGVDEARLRAVNVEATLALGAAAAAAGVRMLFMSSVKALGEETIGRPFDEASTPAPRDAYGRAKADAEAGLRAIPGLALTILRPPLVYGPGVRANFLALLRAIARGWPLPLAGIDNRRSLIFAGNLASAVVRCLESPVSIGRTFCISDGSAISTPVLCRAMGEALGMPARLFRFPPALLELVPPARRLTRSLEVDDAAIRRDLEWSPPFTRAEGLRRTADWYRSQGG
jgi:nucleoside-diphosphate-sugar epimerase